MSAVCLVATAVAACGNGGGAARLDQARMFDGFPLYYAGGAYDGKSLRGSVEDEVKRRALPISFLYGDCKAEGDTGCALPIEVQNSPRCRRPPTPRAARTAGQKRPRRLEIQGHPALAFRDDAGFDRIEVFFPRTTVVVYTEPPDQRLAERIARDLKRVNRGTGPGTACRP